MTGDTEPKRGPGRPPEYKMPPRIDAHPDEIARVVLQAKPKKQWRYMDEANKNTEKGFRDA